MEKPIEITVGGAGPYDPAPNQTDCIIPSLKGMDLVVFQRAVGPKKSSEISILSAGGFRLLNGDKFYADDVYFVTPAGVLYATAAGSYSNGFNFNRVIGALFGRIGWRQGTIEGAPVANANNTTARSGRYFNDFHPLCTLKMVKSLMEDPKATDEEINAYLEGLQRSAIMRSLNGVLNEPEFLEVNLDFDRYREQNDQAIVSSGLFVGRRIRPASLPDIAVQIDSVSLLFDGDVTFPMYLFQEGKKDPMWTGNVTAIANETTVVILPDLILTYLGANHSGGAYYFGYFQDDLGAVKAIDQSRICFNIANNYELENIESQKVEGETNFNRKVIGGSSRSHGLNLQLSAFKDWTTWIVKKQTLFDELIGLQMAISVIELALINVRSNPDERAIKEQLQQLGLWQQLDGVTPGVPDAPKVYSLRDQLNRETARVKKSFYPNFRAINYSSDDCRLN